MFRLKNISAKVQALDVIHPRMGLLRFALKPGEKSGSIEDKWLAYFQENTEPWALVIPQEKSEPISLESIGPVEIETGGSKPKGRPKQRSS